MKSAISSTLAGTILVLLMTAAAAFSTMAVETCLFDSAHGAAQSRKTPVMIETYVDGADIFVDGKHVGTTPLTKPIRVRRGGRVIRVTRRGYADYYETVDIPRRKRTFVIQADLIAISGILRIHTTPSPSQVTLDGAHLGDTPFDGDIDEGERTLLIGTSGYRTHSETLSIVGGETYELDITLEPLPEGAFYTRWWFWTGIVAIAAGTTLAIFLASEDAPTTSGRPTIRLPLTSW